MYATLHQLDAIPGPQDTSWVDGVLSALPAIAAPVGVFVTRPLDAGPAFLLALWGEEAEAKAAEDGLAAAGTVSVGAGHSYEVDSVKTLRNATAHYLALLTFDGPRSADWVAAYARAGEERIWPAIRDVPGLVQHIGGTAADGSTFSASTAESVEALEAMSLAVMSTELLPGEDPAHLTGADSIAVHRLLHADLSVGASR